MTATDAGDTATRAEGEPEFDRATPSPWRRNWSRLRRNRAAMVALAFLVVLILASVFAPLLATHDPIFQNADEFGVPVKYLRPNGEYWLGTDQLGRDVFARLLFGSRVSLRIVFQVLAMATVISLPLGLLAGYKGGRIDTVIMRVVDGFGAFPALILALVTVAFLGPGITNVAYALGLVTAPGFIRIIRAQTLVVRAETFVEASESIGTPMVRILRKRVLRNILSPLIVAVATASGGVLIAESGLSLLGFGVLPPNPSWGKMLEEGRARIYTDPLQLLFPALALALTVLALNIFGDGLRDALGLGTQKVPGLKGRLGLTTVLPAEQRAPRVVPAESDPRHVVPVNVTGGAAPAGTPVGPLLSVRDLAVEFHTEGGRFTVVDGVSFDVHRGEVLGLVGESGSGKSVTSLAVMRLLPTPPARITRGSVHFDGADVLSLSVAEMRRLRGAGMSMVFQDPMTSLNPAFTVGNLLTEVLRRDGAMSRTVAHARAAELLDLVGIPDPARRLRDYPHQLSGGMRQRALIAIALARQPKLLIADEPTTALDVTVQAQILDLLRRLQGEMDLSVVFITHDLAVIADLCDRVAVMYAGKVVEQNTVDDLFEHPTHPYTEGLLGAIPNPARVGQPLASIPGVVPSPAAMPVGCRFAARCPYAEPRCDERGVLDDHPYGSTLCLRAHELSLRGVD